jgi:hypothetical protein
VKGKLIFGNPCKKSELNTLGSEMIPERQWMKYERCVITNRNRRRLGLRDAWISFSAAARFFANLHADARRDRAYA